MGKKRKERKDEFSLDEVLKLGGTKEDFESLKSLEDNSTTKGDLTEELLKDDEFKAFFSSIGFDKVDEMASEEDSEPERDSKTVVPMKAKQRQKQESKLDKTSKKTTSVKEKQKNKERKKKQSTMEPDISAPPVQDAEISSTTEGVSVSKVMSPTAKPLPKVFNHIVELAKIMPKKMTCKPDMGQWYTNEIAKIPASSEPLEADDPIIVNLKDVGRKLLENEAALLKSQKRQDSGNEAWLKTVVTSGTLSDRVAAYTMMIQKAPIHNYRCLDTFVAMLKKKGKREALIGLEALRDVFLAELLPNGRRLRFFHQQPIAILKEIFQQEKGGATTKRVEIQRHLLYWILEDFIKSTYKEFVVTLRDFFLQDSLEAFKTKGMKVVLDLLKSKPEQERELLIMLVNKLGDPKFKIASKALHMLHGLIQEHPLMQGVVVGAVRDLLLRPNIRPKCQYYCICFMSAQILSHDRKEVADLLIQIYLGFFKASVKQKQVDNKLLSAILTGVNRAFPYTSTDDEKILEELNVLYKTVHVSSFGTTVQALMLLFQVLSSRNEVSDRFYNALYSSLLHPELPICTNRHPMFLNLLFRSLKGDPSEARVKSFLKRVIQTCSSQLPAYTSAVLILVTEIVRMKPSLKGYFDFVNRGKKDKGEGNASDLNMVDDESDEEHFFDVDKDESGDVNHADKVSNKSEPENSWTHVRKKAVHSYSSSYDPLHRNPTFANADLTSLWELHQMRQHFHPTVAKFATEIGTIRNAGMPDRYPGDPLQDFTLMRFLDKFVYRNPKAKQEKDDGANQGESVFRRKRKLRMNNSNDIAANTPEFLQKKSYNPEEIFLQRYFASRAGSIQKPKKKVELDEGSDIEEVSDDEFDRFLHSADGQAQLDEQYNFADGTTGPLRKKQKMEMVQDDSEDNEEFGDDDEEVDLGDMEEFGDEDPFSEEGMGFNDVDGEDDGLKPKLKRLKKGGKKEMSSAADAEAFDMMLEENTHNKIGSSGSSAIRNSDRSSAKQLQWERKKEMKEIVARKRERKRAAGFSNGKRNKPDLKKKGSKFQRRKKFGRNRGR